MTHSESIANLAAALVTAQAKMGAAKKSAQNPHLRNKYADLSSVWEAGAEHLHANGIAVLQGVSGAEGTVTVATRLLHSSGEWIEDAVTLPYQESKGINSAQAAGSAITYARRYGLSAILSLPTEDDDGSGSGSPKGSGQGSTPKVEPRASQAAPDAHAEALASVHAVALGKGIADDSILAWAKEQYDCRELRYLNLDQLRVTWRAINNDIVTKWLNERVPS